MLVLTILSLLVAMAAVWYAQRQTKLAETLAKKQEEQEREVYEWQRKHEDVAMALSQVTQQPQLQTPSPPQSTVQPVQPQQQTGRVISAQTFHTHGTHSTYNHRPMELWLK